MNLGATVEVDHSHVRFMGDLMLNLWDCGGYVWKEIVYHDVRQDSFMENYFQSQRAQIFRHVEVLIYIFDIESKDPDVRRTLVSMSLFRKTCCTMNPHWGQLSSIALMPKYIVLCIKWILNNNGERR